MVTLTVDGREVQVAQGTSILTAARMAGAKIPTLCHMWGANEIGACRVCVVAVEGEERLAAACHVPVREGMAVRTTGLDVMQARRDILELILSEHNTECTTCVRGGNCALQSLAEEYGISRPLFDPKPPQRAWDDELVLQRDASKCIKCMRCVAECAKVQHCAVWDHTGSGSHLKVTVRDGLDLREAGCSLCGQCITHCPTGALTARLDVAKVVEALQDPDVVTAVQVAPAVRASWGEGVGLKRDEASPGRMASALRALGFDHVFDTDFAADLTIMEEASEVVKTLQEQGTVASRGEGGWQWPVFTSCCPGWVRFAKQHYPQVVGHLSSAKSPHQMLGAVVKNTLREQAEEAGKRLFVVSVMPCTAKKYECDVPVLETEAGRDVDAVLTVREFCRMLRMFSVNCAALEETAFDDPLGMSTGAGTIFGRTGGVMEAALRTAAYLLTGENPDFSACDTTAASPMKPWVEKVLDVADAQVRIAVASGLENTSKLLDALEAKEVAYDFVEIMACPGGCVGGGGQPIHFNEELAVPRASVLNKLDNADELRYSHENPQIKQLYERWIGEPLSHTAHEWLHTDQQEWAL